jgi:hypothetical protein
MKSVTDVLRVGRGISSDLWVEMVRTLNSQIAQETLNWKKWAFVLIWQEF